MIIDQFSEILLTVDRGRSLVRPGVYKSAKVTVKNSWASKASRWRQIANNLFRSSAGEELKIVEPMSVALLPQYANATQVIKLGQEFIKMALTRPEPPEEGKHRWFKSPIGKLYAGWKKATINDKFDIHLNELALSMGGKMKKWELL